MQKLLRWKLPAEFLRRKRDESRLKATGFCLVSGISLGGVIFAAMLGFIKPLHPIPLYFAVIAISVFVVSTVTLYWLLAFTGPMVVLYDRWLWLKYGYGRYSGDTTIKIPFTEISACRLSRAAGKNSGYVLLQPKLKNENNFIKWELERIEESGIPLSIDSKEIAKILRSGRVIVADNL